MKEAETMAYRILLVEDGSDSGTEQVPPPTGGHLRHAIKCGGVTPTSLDPKTRAAVWADNISPAPNKEWEAEFNWQLAAQASVAGFMGTPPRVFVENWTAHHGRKAQAASASPGDDCSRLGQPPLRERRPRITPPLIWDDGQFELRHPGKFDVVIFDLSN